MRRAPQSGPDGHAPLLFFCDAARRRGFCCAIPGLPRHGTVHPVMQEVYTVIDRPTVGVSSEFMPFCLPVKTPNPNRSRP
jgi:hypothetical protein